MKLGNKTILITILVILSASGKNAAGGIATGQQRVIRGDDPTLPEINAVVHELLQAVQILQSQRTADEQKIQSLTATVQSQQGRLTASENKIQALENSLPSAFAQVAFTVHFSADDGNHGVHLNSQQILQFDSVVTNIGNGYDNKTGIFTAPVAGTYTFFLTQMGTSAHDAVRLAITKQGEVLDLIWAQGSSDQGSGQATTHLTAGEQVWVSQNYGDAVRGHWWTVFTGYLVQADRQ